MSLDWLIVGALAAEVLPLIWNLEHARPVTPRFTSGRLGPLAVGVLRCGVGPAKAERRTREALSQRDARRVLSLGTCGGLARDLVLGQVVTAHGLMEDTRPVRAPTPFGSWSEQVCATVVAPVERREDRERLVAAGAGICEMEAAAVARAAGERPFSVLKVVSDMAGGDGAPLFSAAPWPVTVARFNLRALRLSRDHLTPAVLSVLKQG